MKFSILICTIESRAAFLERLLARLTPQLVDGVEIVIGHDDGDVSIGAKRNVMIAEARGEYVAFVDDDDLVSEDYVSSILTAIECKPNTVGFVLQRYVDGRKDKASLHTLRYTGWANGNEWRYGSVYERTPNHLNPTRADIVRRFPYAGINFGEDRDYSLRIREALVSEVFIDKPLYIYEFRSRRTNEVTHLSRQKKK